RARHAAPGLSGSQRLCSVRRRPPRGVHAEVEPRPNEVRLMAFRSGTQSRHEAIQVLLKTGSVSISRLAVELETSESTIRRDLRDMAAAGEIIRTIGGAASL